MHASQLSEDDAETYLRATVITTQNNNVVCRHFEECLTQIEEKYVKMSKVLVSTVKLLFKL